ncbi:(2Fe-2S) ferredoxin domain-containing protein [Nocardiopsis tropica]|uniref:(2Fe-2S) ferredoxin domain-containing protein n=1 Tax=Nocardiopsis tropica TaxID=109330 RepID=A0ABU7KWL0_9ACTN|nr:(2Fe-2S) ferredoxin domain-containing protein [Nocardiopsis umidischolae]MEE2053467.1 (2Fe-2S) ferredoxin domain-containing protein [Nocardiopsis umidischolae]
MDHKAQLARLGAIEDHSGRTVPVRTSKCLGICFEADVVVVQPSREGRAAGGGPVWLGRVTEDELLEAIDDWIFDGGPGLAPLPAVLADHVTSKDAKKPKKGKKPKHSKAAKKERRKAGKGPEGASRPEKGADKGRTGSETPDKAKKKAEKAKKKAKKAKKARKEAERAGRG